VIRDDQSQPATEAIRLRPQGRRAPASITSSTTAPMTAKSRHPLSSHRVDPVLADQTALQIPQMVRVS
jgi:hypothetical protein